MHKVLVLGAGKIGALISGLLSESGSWEVQLADKDPAAAQGVVLGSVLDSVLRNLVFRILNSEY